MLYLQRPGGTVDKVQVFVAFADVCNLEVRAVPIQFPAGSQGDVAEQEGLSYKAGIFEIGAGGFAAPAGAEPFIVMANRARQSSRWAFEGLHP